MKIGIFVSALVNKGGIERVVLELAKYFDADILTGFYDKEITFSELSNFNIKVLKSFDFPKRFKSFFIGRAFSKVSMDYDLVIFIGFEYLS